jgi:hypothetical protein
VGNLSAYDFEASLSAYGSMEVLSAPAVLLEESSASEPREEEKWNKGKSYKPASKPWAKPWAKSSE